MGAFIPAARARFAERLAYVYGLFPRLKERRNQLAGTMSGGEQQMCAIARALMSGPKLVLLDEPSMGLAPVVVAQVFELVRRIRAEGYTVLIVEQNVRQVLKVVDRAYLLEVGRIKASGAAAATCSPATRCARRIWGCDGMDCQLDIFFLEAVLNGLLLAGLLALLALGLNLVFGVIDVVWICYAELVMVGMYGIHYAHKGGAPFLLAALFGILLIALAGRAAAPISSSGRCSTRAPINQLLVTGGVLFFLQAAATMAFGIEFRNLGIRLGSVEPLRHVLLLGAHRHLRGGARRHAGAVAVPDAHLHRHRDPRDRAGPADHAADGRRPAARSISSPRRSAAGSPASPPP